MDLNDKLAQRRLERQQEAASQKSEGEDLLSQQNQKKPAVTPEIVETNMEHLNSEQLEQALSKQARSRLTDTENLIVLVLAIFGVLIMLRSSFFGGLALLIISGVYFNSRIDEYKKQLRFEKPEENKD